jgi:hypothetical protein
MSYEYTAGQFSLFKNKKKEKDNQPDYTGSGASLSGEVIRIAAWKKKDKNGDLWLSCKISADKPAENKTTDEIPF